MKKDSSKTSVAGFYALRPVHVNPITDPEIVRILSRGPSAETLDSIEAVEEQVLWAGDPRLKELNFQLS